MTVQAVGPLKVALFIDETDMNTHGIGSDGINLELAKSFAQDAFISSGISSGIPPEGQIEIVAFTGKNGIMVFAEIVDSEHEEAFVHSRETVGLYIFKRLDDVIAAACNIRTPYPDAALTYYNDSYYLFVRANDETSQYIRQIITEYGMEVEWNMLFFAHISEHGQTISKKQTFEKLNLIR